MRFLGVDKEISVRYKNKRAWEYDVIDEGHRYHLTNVMASISISQIKRVDEFIESRQQVCHRYSDAFRDIDGVLVPFTNFTNVSPFI